MRRIGEIRKLTDNPYLNLFELQASFRDGKTAPYYVSSRRRQPEDLKAVCHSNRADGVILYGVYGENQDRLVLIRQYRYPIGGYCYEFPSGLIDPGENAIQAGIREMYEETGLRFTPREGGFCQRPFFTSVGMTDECCAMVCGCCSGTPTNCHQEDTEDIQVVLADREECKRILREENVAVMCAYMLMHFIATPGDPLAFLDAIG